jgi:anti-sigma factor RsiW
MVEKSYLSDEERANLVAYLDGELDEEAARALEAKLNRDPRARAEVETLKQTWDLLEYLPRPQPSPTFTNRTLERIAPLQPSAAGSAVRSPWRPWTVGLGWAAAVLLAGAVGFAGVSLVESRESTPPDLIRDLRIIENKRLYERIDDIDFLNQLAQPDLFGDDNTGS